MGETKAAEAYRRTHPDGTKYRLCTEDNQWWWNEDTMDWTKSRHKATLFRWEQVEAAGNIAQKYTPHKIMIDACPVLM